MLLTAILHACGTGTHTTSAVTGGGGGPTGLPLDFGPVLTYGIAGLILAAGLIALVALVAASRATTPRPVALPVPAGATISPDGYYWWDGAAWRPRLE